MTRLLSLLLLAALTAGSTDGQPRVGDSQPDGYVTAERPYATIHAPDEDALREAIEEVSFAALQFERAFGTPPPSIRVVVTHDPTDVAALGLPDDDRATLPFWTRRGLAESPVGAILAAGATFQAVGDVVRVAGVVREMGGPFATGDEVAAFAGRLVSTLDAFHRAFAALREGEPADVLVRRGGAEVTVRVTGERRAPAFRLAGAASGRPLSHEAGHLFLSSYARARGLAGPDAPRTVGRDSARVHYGVPALPDWLDEAFAVWCEVPASVRGRDALLARQVERAIPFDSLFTMGHPLVASGALADLRAGAAPPDGERRPGAVLVTVSSGTAEALGATGLFYAQSGSLLRYLVARRGDGVVGRIVNRVHGGATTRGALSAEGLDPDALVHDWRDWVAATATDA